MLYRAKIFGGLILAALLAIPATQAAAVGRDYQVTITNLTHRINFTPILVASHRRPLAVFEPGTPASDDLAALAEGGDLGPLTTTLQHERDVVDVQNSAGLLGPGESVTVIVRGARYLSLASMMLHTNDGFIGLNSVELIQTEEVMPGVVSGKAPKGRRQEWEVLGRRERAALNENFARELPLEYRAILKDYYERLTK